MAALCAEESVVVRAEDLPRVLELAAFDSGRPEVGVHLERLRALRTELGGLVAEPTPDRVAIDAQLVAIRAEIDAMLADTQALTTGALLDLPPEARATLAASPAATN